MKRILVDPEQFGIFEDPLAIVPAGIRHLLPGFLDRREQEASELSRLLKQRDFLTIRGIAHKLKGSGGGYGLQLFTDIGAEMEIAASHEDAPKIAHLIDQLSIATMDLKGMLILEQKKSI